MRFKTKEREAGMVGRAGGRKGWGGGRGEGDTRGKEGVRMRVTAVFERERERESLGYTWT